MYKRISFLVLISVFSIMLVAQNRHNHPESVVNPGNFPNSQVPQFIVLGSDDNTSAEGLNWILDYLASRKHKDGSSLRMSFYSNSRASVNWSDSSSVDLVNAHIKALKLGHELGNHTSNHAYMVRGMVGEGQVRIGLDSVSLVVKELNNDLVKHIGLSADDVVGFRTPYLAWSDTVFTVINSMGFLYDCSITESRTGPGEYIWPFTMDNGASGIVNSWWTLNHNTNITSHPGLWQLPCYSFKAPHTVRGHMDSIMSANNGLVTGLDYNMWAKPPAGWLFNRSQSLEVLKHTLLLNYNGNRAPMTIGMHSQFYVDGFNESSFLNIVDAAERRAVIEEFIDFALELDNVWFVAGAQVIRYMMNPVMCGEFHPDLLIRDL
ncbi:polysaccharide deacetylase family protein [Alkaliflexus imshenetskii]|uniref:polysaccharide deacetylase family protein n=1 Tax=Alkaliflexus imshenetskii TaxID=286730 RepID=UPI000478983D|nr:polysaccharide deacetylase family protein [Alkaliflexus imshenetskii]